MTQEKIEEAEFLKGTFLFSRLNDEQIQDLAEQAEVKSYNRGDMIYLQNDAAAHFFVVWRGAVRLIHTVGGNKPNYNLGLLIFGDFFGEECFSESRYLDTAIARDQVQIFQFKKSTLLDLFSKLSVSTGSFFSARRKQSEIERMIRGTIQSRKLARRKRFNRVGDDEAVYLINRKHKVFLVLKLVLPSLLISFGLVFLLYIVGTGNFSGITSIFYLIPLFLGIAWFVWNFVDWGNDYYVATSQRVFAEELIILLYESRRETPLEAVRQKAVLRNPIFSKFFDYGMVTVEHYTGKLVMPRSERPDLMITFLDGLMARSLMVATQISDQAMVAAIRRHLGLPEKTVAEDNDQEDGSQPGGSETKPAKPVASSTKRTRLGEVWFYLTSFFYMHFEDGDNIFYRKHWFILIKKTWLPGLVNIFWLAVGVYLWRSGLFSFRLNLLFWLIIFLGVGFWWLYNLLDWHDDVFILTLDKIIDIDKKPFLSARKNEATLDRILSIEHSRVGLTGILLNYGTVIIKVGETPFTFDLVRNPAEVQYEISERKNAYHRRHEEALSIKEREKYANWMALYYKQAIELENLEKSTNENRFSG